MGLKLTGSRGYDPMTQRTIARGDLISVAATSRFGDTQNVADFAFYEALQSRGLDRYFSREAWMALKEQRKVATS